MRAPAVPQLPSLSTACTTESSMVDYLRKLGKLAKPQLADCVKAASRKLVLEVCTLLQHHVQQAFDALHHLSADMAEDEQSAVLMDAIMTLRGAAILAHDLLLECKAAPPPALHAAAVQLHDYGILALENCPEVHEPVAKLCCSWWDLQAEGKESLVAQTLPHLLMRTTNTGKASDVKLCYGIREALLLLDFDDSSIGDMKRLLLKASFHPAFLTRPDGRKFIAFLFTLQPMFVGELNAVIRQQIPSCRRSVLEAYGEICFRAWKEAAGGCLYQVETQLLQGLMQSALTASTPSLSGALRCVLKGLHDQKRLPGVDAMLLRLYEPLIFRAAAAANAAVRRNALKLLLDAFPLMDPDAEPDVTDELLTRQFMVLRSGLSDECPLVRVCAVEGVSSLLNLFWEIIPASTTAMFISKLTGELAFDMSWPAVRVAVLEGLLLLVDNQHAQPVLKKTLPSLASLLADPSLRVREEMAALLVAVSSTNALHFYEVVPLDSLLQAMSNDVESVSHKIQQILVPSYFPTPEEGSARVAALLRANPPAGKAFCQFLVSSYLAQGNGGISAFTAAVPIEHVLQLAIDLKSHLLGTGARLVSQGGSTGTTCKSQKASRSGRAGGAKAKTGAGKRRKQPANRKFGIVTSDAVVAEAVETHDEENTGSEIVEDEGETAESWASILDGCAYVCEGLAAALAGEHCADADVQAAFEDDSLLLLLQLCPTAGAKQSVLKIVGCLPGLTAASVVRAHFFELLAQGQLMEAIAFKGTSYASPPTGDANVEVLEQQQTLLRAIISCLCASPVGAKLLGLITAALSLRPPAPIHKPARTMAAKRGVAAATPGGFPDDHVLCACCGDMEPEDCLLMCDGCDCAYHMQCMQPVMVDVPLGDWFCQACEEQLQKSELSRPDALRLLSAMLELAIGRETVLSHHHFRVLLAGAAHWARTDVSSLVEGGVSSTHGSSSAPGLYCRLSLHLALMALQHRATNPEAADAEAQEAEADGHGGTDAADLRPVPIGMALVAAAEVLSEGIEMCEQLIGSWDRQAATDTFQADDGTCVGGNNDLALLQPISNVLGVLCDAKFLTLLQLETWAVRVCGLATAVTELASSCVAGAAAVLEPVVEERQLLPGGAHGEDVAVAAVGHVLTIARQLAIAISASSDADSAAASYIERGSQAVTMHGPDQRHTTSTSHGIAGSAEEWRAPRLLQQQLTRRLASSSNAKSPNELSDASEEASVAKNVAAAAAVESLVGALLMQLSMAECAGLAARVRLPLAALLAAVLEPSCKVPRGWLTALTTVMGVAIATTTCVPVGSLSAEAEELFAAADGEENDNPDMPSSQPASHQKTSSMAGVAGATTGLKCSKRRAGVAPATIVKLRSTAAAVKNCGMSVASMPSVVATAVHVIKARKAADRLLYDLATAALDAWQREIPEVALGPLALLTALDVCKLQAQGAHAATTRAAAKLQRMHQDLLIAEQQLALGNVEGSRVPKELRMQLARSLSGLLA